VQRIVVRLHGGLLPERLLRWHELQALRDADQGHVRLRHHLRQVQHRTEMQHQ
jgi:hypothetical protein